VAYTYTPKLGLPLIPDGDRAWGAAMRAAMAVLDDAITAVAGTDEGGTNITTYAVGDLLYASATNTLSKLAGNITTSLKVLTQVGSGAASAAPSWSATTGLGSVVLAIGATLTAPVLGAATATSINRVVLTSPATAATLTILDNKTLTVANTLTLSGADGSTLNVGTGGTLGTAAYIADSTLAHLAGVETITGAKTFTTNTVISVGSADAASPSLAIANVITPTANTANGYACAQGITTTASAFNFTSATNPGPRGLFGTVQHSGTGLVTKGAGVMGQYNTTTTGGGTTTGAAFHGRVLNQSTIAGDIAQASCYLAQVPFISGTGTIGDYAAFQSEAITTTATRFNCFMRSGNVTGGTTGNYQLYLGTGKSVFADTTSGTSTTSAAVTANSLGLAENLWVGGSINGASTGNFTGAVFTSNVVTRSASGVANGLYLRESVSGLSRWYINADATNELGADTGHNFVIRCYTDAGAALDNPITIIRAAGGLMTVVRPLTVSSTTDATSPTAAASFLTNGGAGIAKALWVGGLMNVAGVATLGNLLVVPKTSGMGIKVDTTTPTFAWKDKEGVLNYASAVPGALNIYQGTVRDYSFSVNDQVDCKIHIPHDYAMGTDIFVHVHWSHIGTAITGNFAGNFKHTYAKGHNQAAFPAEKTLGLTYATVNIATTPQRRHRIDEVQLSVAGGSATQMSTADIEPDGLLLINWLQTGIPTITGTIVEPFIHYIDLHYQSTGIGTKAKVGPTFWT
jgi:hypothetical protein